MRYGIDGLSFELLRYRIDHASLLLKFIPLRHATRDKRKIARLAIFPNILCQTPKPSFVLNIK